MLCCPVQLLYALEVYGEEDADSRESTDDNTLVPDQEEVSANPERADSATTTWPRRAAAVQAKDRIKAISLTDSEDLDC